MFPHRTRARQGSRAKKDGRLSFESSLLREHKSNVRSIIYVRTTWCSRAAKWLRTAATSGCSGPCAASRVAIPRKNSASASSACPTTRVTRKQLQESYTHKQRGLTHFHAAAAQKKWEVSSILGAVCLLKLLFLGRIAQLRCLGKSMTCIGRVRPQQTHHLLQTNTLSSYAASHIFRREAEYGWISGIL